MKVRVPLWAFGQMGHAMFDAGVGVAVLERDADCWIVEFMAPDDRAAFMHALEKIGVKLCLADKIA